MLASASAPASFRRPEAPAAFDLLLDTTMGEQIDPADGIGGASSAENPQEQSDEEEEEDGAAAAAQNDEDEFVFNAPAYYDLRNPSLFERQYVNNADGYFSSPAPSAATSRSSPLTADSAVEKQDDRYQRHQQEAAAELDPVTRSLGNIYSAMQTGKKDATADAEATRVPNSQYKTAVAPVGTIATSAFSQSVPRLENHGPSAFSQTVPSLSSAFAQSVPSLGNQEAGSKASPHPPSTGKSTVVLVDNNVLEDAEMAESTASNYAASAYYPSRDGKSNVQGSAVSQDNQERHEQDADEQMSDAESEGTVEMDTSAVMADVSAPSGTTADAVASSIEEEDEETAATILSRSLLSENGSETLEEVLEKYATSSQSSATSHRMQDVETGRPSSHSSFHSSRGSMSPRHRAGRRSPPPPLSEPGGMSWTNSHPTDFPPPPRSTGSYNAHTGVSSRLLQPTESFLLRMHAEQRMREQSYLEDIPVEEKPHRVTKPHSPKLRTSQKAEARPRDPNDVSRMSSTSRELLKIQEERLRLQMERMKIREFHEKTKVQRPPANVFQRSTKQLTIPESPHFAVDSRARRFHRGGSSDSGSDGAVLGDIDTNKPTMITPEALLSREYEFPAAKLHKNQRTAAHHPTVPHTPQLQTATRASRRGVVPDASKPAESERPRRPASAHTAKFGGLTQPVTPQLETRRRAQTAATYRRPIDVKDEDEQELARKFHARPVNKKILENKVERLPSKAGGKPALTQPVSPKLTTSTRSTTRPGATLEMERKRQEREQRQAATSRQAPAQPRRPVIPETPPLKSIQLHRQYQEQFRRRIEEEQKELERQRDFKANPMRVTSTPPRFEGSSKPLTEIKPFAMPGEKHHELARERLELKRREEEERLKASAKFRANPMPVFSGNSESEGDRAFHPKPSAKPLTSFAAPVLASDRRAAERAAFDAAERERREMEEAYRKRVEEETRRLEEEEVKRLRKEEMVFRARPAPEPKTFTLKSNTKLLTEPMTPVTHFRSRESDKQ